MQEPQDSKAAQLAREADPVGLYGVNAYIWGTLFPVLYLTTAPRKGNPFLGRRAMAEGYHP